MHSDTQEPGVYKFKGQGYVVWPCFQQSIHKNNMEGRKVGLVESYLKMVFDELLEMWQERPSGVLHEQAGGCWFQALE